MLKFKAWAETRGVESAVDFTYPTVQTVDMYLSVAEEWCGNYWVSDLGEEFSLIVQRIDGDIRRFDVDVELEPTFYVLEATKP